MRINNADGGPLDAVVVDVVAMVTLVMVGPTKWVERKISQQTDLLQ